MDVDSALRLVGGYKRGHFTAFLCVVLSCYYCLSWQKLSTIFIAWTPNHHCRVPEGSLLNETIPPDGKGDWDKCRMYSNLSLSNLTIPCTHGWTYYTEGYKTIATEWDLVCDKDYLPELSQTMYQIAEMLGQLSFTFVIDYWGRKWTVISGVLATGACGLIMAFMPNIVGYIVMKFCIGALALLACIAGLTYCIELFDSKRRAFIGLGLLVVWTSGYMTLGGLAFALPNWRHLQIVISSVICVLIMSVCLLPESVVWLVSEGRLDDAEEILQQWAHYNGVSVQDRLLKEESEVLYKKHTNTHKRNSSIQDGTKEEEEALDCSKTIVETYNMSHLLKVPVLRKQFIIITALWAIDAIVYYTLSWNSPHLLGDRFLNYFLLGLVEIPGFVTSYYCIRRSRRWSACGFHLATAIALIIASAIPPKTASGVNLGPLATTFSIAGKFFVCGSFGVVILYAMELFPTSLRATTTGLSWVAASLGTVSAPFIVYASKHVLWLPSLIMGLCGMTVGVLALLLPETAGKPLPQTIAEVEMLYEKKSKQDLYPANGKPIDL